ncbi:RNA polymerase sigma factor [Bacillus sp. FSL K6-3431]|uniref:RNA polymerase sigma factor n=1 Tax=Bacillus sp. FSL K6-3431 TaxID=2921500 RepID=UPI0030FBD9EC
MSYKNNNAYIKVDSNGSLQSIDAIYLMYKDQIYRFVYRYSNDRQFSIDIVQDTFEKLLKKNYLYIPEKGNFKTYLFQIAYNTMMTKLKRRQKFKAILPFLAAESPHTFALEEKLLVQKAVQSLSDEQRAVIILSFYHDLTQRETARILGIPVGTVKSRLHHALKKLKADLEVENDEESG